MNRDPMVRELARQHAEDANRKDDELGKSLQTTMERELKLISKQPLKKPCRAAAGLNQVPSQVFLIDQPVASTFVLDLPLESIASIHNVQARVALMSTSK